ncbi:hypothetical protein NC652_026584 [Populus alba x Populus x berolinensis]|nr:hypothetical protein NC652_026584 [Populus alba x Populus x berolinensis]
MNEYRLVGFRRERWKALFFRWRNSTRARSYSGTGISHDGSETLTLGETAIKETEGKGRRGGSRERREEIFEICQIIFGVFISVRLYLVFFRVMFTLAMILR